MIINSTTLVAILLLAGCNGCQPTPAPAPPPAPVVDAAPPVADAAPVEASPHGPCGTAPTCTNACCHGFDMGCDWAKPSPGGGSCELRCAAYTDSSTPAPLRWNLAACVAAQTCEQCR